MGEWPTEVIEYSLVMNGVFFVTHNIMNGLCDTWIRTKGKQKAKINELWIDWLLWLDSVSFFVVFL